MVDRGVGPSLAKVATMLADHPLDRPSPAAAVATRDVDATPAAAFALLCRVETWPVWLSFLRTASRDDETVPLGLGSEIVLRATMPGELEERYEVDRFIDGYLLSLVGAYSLRRRIDFRIERRGDRAKLALRVDYPAYGGAIGVLLDRVTARRRLATALDASLAQFKGLVEFSDGSEDGAIADF